MRVESGGNELLEHVVLVPLVPSLVLRLWLLWKLYLMNSINMLKVYQLHTFDNNIVACGWGDAVSAGGFRGV